MTQHNKVSRIKASDLFTPVVMATCDTASDDKVGTMTTFGF